MDALIRRQPRKPLRTLLPSTLAALLALCGLACAAGAQQAGAVQREKVPAGVHPSATSSLQRILRRGNLRCGIDSTEAEYTTTDDHGPRLAFDTAFCRAVAVALLGPQATFTVQRFPDDTGAAAALRAGTVDLVPTLSADLTHTTDSTLALTTPVLHDSVTLLVPAAIANAADLRGKKICFLAETETEVALQDWDHVQSIGYLPFPFQEEGEMEAAFVTGNCAATAADATRLGTIRASLGTHAAGYTILPLSLRDDPLAIAVAARNQDLLRLAQWTLQALLVAEETGITAANASAFPIGKSEAADRLLGRTGNIGRPFHLRDTWALDVLTATGNFAELYTRTLGSLAIPRGPNALCRDSGAMCPLPLK